MKLPKNLLTPFKNPFVEAKRQELAIAMTKKMINEAIKDGKNLAKERDAMKGQKPKDSA